MYSRKILVILFVILICSFTYNSSTYAENKLDNEVALRIDMEIKKLEGMNVKNPNLKKLKKQVLSEVDQMKKKATTPEDLTKISRIVNQTAETLENDLSYDLQFDIFSDVHVGNRNYDIYLQALEDIKYLTPNSSATLFNGDNTDGGSEQQYADFYNPLKEKNVVEPLIILGNHEARWQANSQVYKDRYLKWNQEYMGDAPEGQLYWSRWIEGYHFIGLNTELDLKDSAYLSPEQIAWVEKEIAIDADPDKPIFLQIHQTFKGTGDTYDGDTIYYPADNKYPENSPEKDYDCEEALKDVLKKYPQVVIFTGHVHTDVNNLKVYPREYGHVVDLPDFKRDLAYQVSVKDSDVTLKLRDYKNDVWIEDKEITFSVKDTNGLNTTEDSSSNDTTSTSNTENSSSNDTTSTSNTEDSSSNDTTSTSNTENSSSNDTTSTSNTEDSSSNDTTSTSNTENSSSNDTTSTSNTENSSSNNTTSTSNTEDSSSNDTTSTSNTENSSSNDTTSTSNTENSSSNDTTSTSNTENSSSNDITSTSNAEDSSSNNAPSENSLSNIENLLPETGYKKNSEIFILMGILLLFMSGLGLFKKF